MISRSSVVSNRWTQFSRIALAFAAFGLLVVGSITQFTPAPAHASAGINKTINYQGRLLNAAGAVVADGTYNMEFQIWQDGNGCVTGCTSANAAANNGGTLMWTEDWVYGVNSPDNRVTVKNGYFSVNLGSICLYTSTTCTASTGNSQTNSIVDFNQSALYLSMNVGNVTTAATFAGASGDGYMIPFRRMASAVYALQANSCTTCILQAPSSTAQNTITPTVNSVVGLTVNATTGTAALALSVVQSQAADAANIAVSSSGTTVNGLLVSRGVAGTTTNALNVTNATGTTTNGLAITNSSGTTTTGISITQSGGTFGTGVAFGGTLTTGISFGSSTITTDITRTTGALTLQGTGGVTITGAGTSVVGLDTAGAGTVSIGTTNAATLTLGSTNAVTINVGSVAPVAARTTTIAGGASGFVDTVNIGTGATTVAGGKTIHIGDTTPTGSGTNLVTIGAVGAFANVTTIQGGNGTGASAAIRLSPADAGDINIGTTTETGTIRLGQATVGNTITIGNGAETGAQVISIGTGATSGTDAVTIGSLIGASAATLQSGTGSINLNTNGGASSTTGTIVQSVTNNSTKAFQIQNTSGSSGVLFNADTSGSRITVTNIAANIATPELLIKNTNASTSSDASIEFNNAQNANSIYAGQDASNGGAFTIGSSTAASNNIRHVQSNANNNNGASTTIAQAFTTNVTSGNTVVASLSWDSTSTTTVGCADTLGSSFTVTTVRNDATNKQALAVCYAHLSSGGADTITATLGASSASRFITVHEYSGIAAASFTDGSIGVGGSTATTATDNASSTAITTTVNGDLIYGAVMDTAGGNYITAGTGFRLRTTLNGISLADEEQIQTTAGSIAATNTFGTAHRYDAIVVAFKAASFAVADTFNNALLTVSQAGSATFKNAADSGAAFQIQDTSGTSMLNVDTANRIVATTNLQAATVSVGYGAGIYSNAAHSYLDNRDEFTSASNTASQIYTDNNGIHFQLGQNGGVGSPVTWWEPFTLNTGGAGAGLGSATFKNNTNSSTAFQIQNTAGESLLNVDTTTTNLLKNSGFEPTTTTNWAARGTTSTFAADSSAGNVYHGASSLKSVITAANSGMNSTGLGSAAFTSAITTGTQYQMTIMAKCSGSIGTLTIGREDVAGTPVNVLTNGACTTGWQQFTAHWTTGGTITNPNVYVTLGAATSGTIWIDAVSLIQTNTSAATNYRVGAITDGGIYTNPTIFQNTADSPLALQVQSANGTNVLNVDTANGAVAISGGTAGSGTAATITTGAASNVGETLQGASSQTANLLQLIDNTGSQLASFDATGNFNSSGTINTPLGGIGQFSNLINNSETLDTWTATNVTVTANDAGSNPAPDGQTTAEKLVSTAGNGTVAKSRSTGVTGNYTFSIWLKTNASTQPVQLRIDSTAGTPTTGTPASFTATTTWQRFSVTQNFTGSPTAIIPTVVIVNNAATVVGWGGQLVTGTIPQVYTKTGAQTVAGSLYGLSAPYAVLGAQMIESQSSGAVASITRAAAGQSVDLFELQDSGALVNASFGSTGAVLTLGRASNVTGQMIYNNSGGSAGITLQGAATNTGGFTLTLPAETGTLCSTGNVCAGYAAAGTGYIPNNTTQSTGNFNIISSGAANIGGFIQGAASASVPELVVQAGTSQTNNILEARSSGGSPILAIYNTGDVYGNGLFSSFNANTSTLAVNFRSGDSLTAGNTGGATYKSGNSTSGNSGNVTLSSGTAAGGGKTSGSISIDAGTVSGGATAGSISIGTGAATAVTIGSTTGASATTIQGGATGSITLQTNNASAGTLIKTATNTGTALQIQDASSNAMFTVDNTADASNLITNPSFEATGTATWAAKSGAAFSNSPAQAYTGTKSMVVTTTATANDGVKYPLVLTALTPYQFSFDAYGGSTFATMLLGYSSDGTTEATYVTTAQTVTSGAWKHYYVNFTTPASVAGGAYFFIKQSDAVIHTMYIDDVNVDSRFIGANYNAGGYNDSRISIGGDTSSITNLGIGTSTPDAALEIDQKYGQTGLQLVSNGDNNLYGANLFQIITQTGTTAIQYSDPIGRTTINGGYAFYDTPALQVNTVATAATAVRVSGIASQTADIFQVSTDTSAANSVLSAGALTTSNLVTNYSFESDVTTGWAPTASATMSKYVASRANIYHGSASALVTTSASAKGAVLSGFTAAITPAQYTFSFNALGGTNTGTLGVTITGGSAPACALSSTAFTTTGFTNYSCTFTSTTTNVTAITIATTGGSNGTFYLDGIGLNTGATAAPFMGTGAVQLRGVVNSTATFQNSSNSTTAFQVQSANGTNLLAADTLNGAVSVGGALNVSGTATANTVLVAVGAGLDTASAGTLNIGLSAGGNATGININQNTVLTGSNNLTVGTAATCTSALVQGKVCITQTSAAGGTTANLMNVQTYTGSTAYNAFGQYIKIDTSGASGLDRPIGLYVDFTATNPNDTANTAGIQVRSNQGAGYLLRLQGGNTSAPLTNGQTDYFAVDWQGVATLRGAQAPDLTTASSTTAVTALGIRPGTLSAASSTGATMTIQGGYDSGGTSSIGGPLVLKGGNATGAGTQTGGDVTIDSGTGSTAGGAISIGGTSAASIGVGRAGKTTTFAGNLTLTAGATVLTGQAAAGGTAVAITSGNTTNVGLSVTGIVSQSANIATLLTTGGVGLTVSAVGNIGIDDASPGAALDVTGTTSQSGTGTLTTSAGTVVTGSGTSFTTQMHVGDTITAAGQTQVVELISSNTSLTTLGAFTPSLSAAAFTYLQASTNITAATNQNLLNLQGDSANTSNWYFVNAVNVAGTSEFRVRGDGTVNAHSDIVTSSGNFRSPDTATSSGAVSLASGISSSSGTSGSTTISTGTTASGVSGAISIISGAATGGNSGAVSVDSGTSSATTGIVSVGTTNASAINIGHTGVTTAVTGAATHTGQTSAGGTAVAITSGNTTNVGLIIQGFAAQTADLLDMQASDGSNLRTYDSAGNENTIGTIGTPYGSFGNFGNLLPRSEGLDQSASWTATNITVAANNTAAPNGQVTAEKLTNSATNGTITESTINVAVGATYTYSVYLKTQSGAPTVTLRIDGSTSGTGTTPVTVTPGANWQRYSVTQDTSLGSLLGNVQVFMQVNGVSTKAVYAWGAQVVAGSSPGAYTTTGGGLSLIVATAAEGLVADNAMIRGQITLGGGLGTDITSGNGSQAAGVTYRSGNSSVGSGTGSTTTIQGGNESGSTAAVGGLLQLSGGDANTPGATQTTGGSVAIDAGLSLSSTTALLGSISIGTVNAGTLNVATNNLAHTIHIGDGGTNTVQAITIGSNASSTSTLTLSGGIVTTTNNQAGVIVGNGYSSSDTNLTVLTLDSTTTYGETASTCAAAANGGALYYNSTSNSVRACQDGAWSDVITAKDTGLIMFGVVPDSGATNPGDLAGIVATGSGPCRVYMGNATNKISWTGCVAYSGGRRVIVAAGTNVAMSANTASNWSHLCLNGANNQASLTAINASETATLPTWSATAPILCLADVQNNAGGTAIGAIFDTRTFTTSTKQIVNVITTAPALGMLVKNAGVVGQYTPTTAAGDQIQGVVVVSANTTTANTMNAIIATGGPASVKVKTTGTVNQYIIASATAGYTTTSGTINGTAYANAGLAITSIATACTLSTDTCRGSVLVNFLPR